MAGIGTECILHSTSNAQKWSKSDTLSFRNPGAVHATTLKFNFKVATNAL